MALLEWQRFVLRTWLGVTEGGTWAAPTCGLLVARQNGKTEGVLLVRVAFGLLYLGERIIFTSHRQDSATEFYNALKGFLDTESFRRYVEPDGFKGALGRERINMRSGAYVQFVCRSNKGGRSKHSDLIVFDEAQYLDHSEQASFTPTQETSPNPQIIYAGTPPDKAGYGGEFAAVRRRAMQDGNPGMAWCEWAVDEYPEDVADKGLWYQCNPSLGMLIKESNVELQLNNLDADDFAREVLCWWAPEKVAGESAIDLGAWEECETEEPPAPDDDERLACGIKFSADGSTYSVSMAARPKEGPVLVECIDRTGTAHGIGGLIDWVWERRGELATVRVDGRQWTATLVQNLMERGFPRKALEVASTTNMVDACAMFAGGVLARNLVHTGQPLLNDSIATSPRRQVGFDGWAFGGDDPTPAESCALAYWGAMTTKRNPRRRMKVSI